MGGGGQGLSRERATEDAERSEGAMPHRHNSRFTLQLGEVAHCARVKAEQSEGAMSTR